MSVCIKTRSDDVFMKLAQHYSLVRKVCVMCCTSHVVAVYRFCQDLMCTK